MTATALDAGTSRDADVVIIGAGVIGSALAYELSRRGRRTLNLDALPSAGYGSTSYSSAIVRFSYSTLAGVAMAWEARHYWRDWPAYLGGAGGPDLAELVTCGMALLDPADMPPRWCRCSTSSASPTSTGMPSEVEKRLPLLDARVMGPPTGVDDEAFWAEPSEPLAGAVWMPDAGYVNDPQLAARNLQHAAEALGARFRFRAEVVGIERDDERVTGVTLADGTVVRAPVVVNVAGPDSARVNRLAGLEGTMAIGTRPMRQEVHHVPSPVGPDGRVLECMVGDDDTGIYFRPEAGGMIAVGSLEPSCDEQEWLDSTDGYQRSVTKAGWERQTLRLARRIPDPADPQPPARDRRRLRRR